MYGTSARLSRYFATVPWAIVAFSSSVTLLGRVGPSTAGFIAVGVVVVLMAIVAANYAFVYRLSASHGELRLKKYFGVPPVTFQVGSIDRVAVGVRGRGRMLGTVCFLAGDRHLQIQPRTWETAPLTALLADLREQGVEVDDGVWDVVNPGAAPPPE